MKGIKEDLKFTISAQSVKEKLEDYKAFIKEEDDYLSTMIRNRIELKLVESSIRDTAKTGKLRRKPGLDKLNSFQTENIETDELTEESEANLFYGESGQVWKKREDSKTKKFGKPMTKSGDNKVKNGDNKVKYGENKVKPNGYKGATRPTNGDNLRPCAIGCGTLHPHGSLLHCKE